MAGLHLNKEQHNGPPRIGVDIVKNFTLKLGEEHG